MTVRGIVRYARSERRWTPILREASAMGPRSRVRKETGMPERGAAGRCRLSVGWIGGAAGERFSRGNRINNAQPIGVSEIFFHTPSVPQMTRPSASTGKRRPHTPPRGLSKDKAQTVSQPDPSPPAGRGVEGRRPVYASAPHTRASKFAPQTARQSSTRRGTGLSRYCGGTKTKTCHTHSRLPARREHTRSSRCRVSSGRSHRCDAGRHSGARKFAFGISP